MTNIYRNTLFVTLLALLLAAIAGLILTSAWVIPSLRPIPGRSRSATAPLVDTTPLTTAENLAALAITPRERQFADEAVRLADQDVDQAFETALRHTEDHPISMTPEARQLAARVTQTEADVRADEEELARLKSAMPHANDARKAELQTQLETAQARLSIDQDQRDDARRDFARATDSDHSRLQRQLEEHEKAQSHPAAVSAPAPAATPVQPAGPIVHPTSLIGRIGESLALRSEHDQLDQAQQNVKASAAALLQSHNALELEVKKPQPSASANSTQSGAPPAVATNPKQGSAVAAPPGSVKSNAKQLDLADLDKRIDAEQKLDDLYGKWIALVHNRELRALHRLILSLFWITLIALLSVFAEIVLGRYVSEIAPDRKRMQTILNISRFALRAFCVLLILLVVFGPPSQLATVIALATAGLTVALKDFIVGFFGWFVLMGRNGVRPGDWVEINGVQGKVTDVGILHTVVLETGNWTAAGHPTGRRVTFINSYAIEGHYFNFSTAGQWLWDELQIALPAVRDPYPVMEAVQKIVLTETQDTSKVAEQEWQHVAGAAGLRSVSSAPTVSVRPTDSGATVIVRYVARADERVQLRARLYRAIFEFLIRKNVLPPGAEDSPAPPVDAKS